MDPSAIAIADKSQNTVSIIIFEKPSKSYFAGELVCGTVKFQAQENQSVQTFSVQLRGEFYFMKDDVEHVENIFTESSPIDYRGAGEGNVEMDFNLVLKPTSPTSLHSSLGGIRYRVLSTVVFSENDSMKMAEASQQISVNQPHEVPEDCLGRSVSTVEKTGAFCCIRSIIAELGISSTFLLSGQPALISGTVINETKSSIMGTVVNLVQSLQRQKDGRKIKKNAFSLQKGAILPGKRQTWFSEYTIVPPLPPTSSDSYFKVWYDIVMEIRKVGGKIIKLKLPVVVGNVPAKKISLNTGDFKFQWSSSETQGDPKEFVPLYATHVP